MTTSPRIKTRPVLVATLLSLAMAYSAFADGRADWRDYAWDSIDLAACLPRGDQLACPPFREKWDWKRNQWVDIALTIDPADATIHLTQQLANNDPRDEDYVCVTALLVDSTGRTIAAHHQNWHIAPGQTLTNGFTYSAPALSTAASIQIGSKQCRKGAGQDDQVYAAVLAGIQR